MLLNQYIFVVYVIGMLVITTLVVAAYYLPRLNRNKIHNKGFIEGEWKRSGISPEGELWWFQFSFDAEKVEMKGQPDFHTTAQYKIIKEIENLLVLELHQIEGDLLQNGPLINRPILNIAVDKKQDKLTIDGRSGYKRLT